MTKEKIIVAVVIALLVGSSAPWWWEPLITFLNPDKQQGVENENENGRDGVTKKQPPDYTGGTKGSSDNDRTPIRPEQPSSDFPGGSKSIYIADFNSWQTKDSEYGSVKLGFGNLYVLAPSRNIWIGGGGSISPPLEGDFVFDVRFRIAERHPSAGLNFDLTGGGTDAESVSVYFHVLNDSNVPYTIERGRVRSDGAFYIREENIADGEQLSSALKAHDWSKGSKLTLKREGGNMQFFVNDGFVKDFAVSLFPVMKIHVAASGSSKVVITSIEARVKR